MRDSELSPSFVEGGHSSRSWTHDASSGSGRGFRGDRPEPEWHLSPSDPEGMGRPTTLYKLKYYCNKWHYLPPNQYTRQALFDAGKPRSTVIGAAFGQRNGEGRRRPSTPSAPLDERCAAKGREIFEYLPSRSVLEAAGGCRITTAPAPTRPTISMEAKIPPNKAITSRTDPARDALRAQPLRYSTTTLYARTSTLNPAIAYSGRDVVRGSLRIGRFAVSFSELVWMQRESSST